MSREQLEAMALDGLAHYRAGTQGQETDVMRIPASYYYDRDRWQQEMDLVFKRMPLMLAFSCELREPNSYRAMDVGDVPVLLTRAPDGAVRAFLNVCSHRGAIVVEEGSGVARRFSCPYPRVDL